jgi:cell division transport system ATP-binding protein
MGHRARLRALDRIVVGAGGDVLIDLDTVRFAFGDNVILDQASMSLEPGSLHFLTGRSGAGKTTLLRLVFLDLAPGAGVVRLFGRDAAGLTRRERAAMRRRFGLVLQDCDLVEELSVLENIALPLRLAGVDPTAREGDIRALAEWVRIDPRLDARPAELPSGERRRAAVARAVVGSPDAVIADEPTGDVDAEAADRIFELFLELHRAGRTVLIATHDLALVRKAQGRTRARTLRLEAGRIIRAGAAL